MLATWDAVETVDVVAVAKEVAAEVVRRDPKVLRRVSRILIKKGLHFANLFCIFE
jgi:hypothetical protein